MCLRAWSVLMNSLTLAATLWPAALGAQLADLRAAAAEPVMVRALHPQDLALEGIKPELPWLHECLRAYYTSGDWITS